MGNLPRHQERVALWDNLKFVLILLVVIGHFVDYYIEAPTFQSIFVFIYAVHMPLFILIAGFFHRDTNIAAKVVSYLICGFLVKFVLLFANQAFGRVETDFFLFTTNDISWFMFAMAAYILMTYLVRELNKKLILLIAFIIACMASYDNTMGDFLSWGRIVTFFPFYMLGSILNPNFFLRIKRHRWSYPLGFSIVVLWGLCCYYFLEDVYKYRLMFTGHIPFSELPFEGGGIQTRLFTMLVSALLCIGWILLVPSGRIPLFSTWGQRTLQVYFWHVPALKILNYFHITDICQPVAGKACYLGIAFLLTCLLSTPIFGFPTSHVQTYIVKRRRRSINRN